MYKAKLRFEHWVVAATVLLAICGVNSYFIPHADQQPSTARPHSMNPVSEMETYPTPPSRVSSYAAPLVPSEQATYESTIRPSSKQANTLDIYTDSSTAQIETNNLATTETDYPESTTHDTSTTTFDVLVQELKTANIPPEVTTDQWKLETKDFDSVSYEGTTAANVLHSESL